MLFIRKYRKALKELIQDKSYVEAAAAVVMFPVLYGVNVILGEVNPDDVDEGKITDK